MNAGNHSRAHSYPSDPYVKRGQTRLTTMWATNITDCRRATIPFYDALYCGRYKPFLEFRRARIPSMCFQERLTERDLRFPGIEEQHVAAACFYVLRNAKGAVQFLLDIDIRGDFETLINVMILCYERNFFIKQLRVDEYACQKIAVRCQEATVCDDIYYQSVNVSRTIFEQIDESILIRSLVTRFDARNLELNEVDAEKFARRPQNLNLRRDSLCILTPYVAVLYNHQEYIESTMILSISQYVTAVQSLALLRQNSFEILRRIHEFESFENATRKEAAMVFLVEKSIEMLQLELAMNVEEPMDLSLLLPSIRAQDFHGALFEVGEIKTKINNISQTFGRIEKVLMSVKGAAQAFEGEIIQIRRGIFAGIASALSIITIPVTITLAFFSAPLKEAPKDVSIFAFADIGHIYLVVFGVFATAFAVAFFVWSILHLLAHRRRKRMIKEVFFEQRG